jgi:DNA-binding MarR family transcriptional regulator
MDFFLLASISRGGLRSLYDLKQQAGLEPGGIRLLLNRLERDGLLERSEQQKRRRRLMTVTEKGSQMLKEGWQRCLGDYPDAESVLRAATVAMLMGDRMTARAYLTDIADRHEWKAQTMRNEPDPMKSSALEWYSHMRASWETRRRRSAATLFREIAREMEGMGRTS